MIKSVSLACGGGGAEMNVLINDVIFIMLLVPEPFPMTLLLTVLL